MVNSPAPPGRARAPGSGPTVLTIYTGDVLAASRFPVVTACRGDQALAAGSEPETRTGLGRQLVDGARLLENGPSPCQRESPTVTLAAAPPV